MVGAALKVLQQGHPAWTFGMYDCARSRKVQLVMWDIVKGTPQQGYVATPHTPPGSIHNTGCAVDLSVWDTATKAAVDMGTPYDFFGSKAHPAKEVELWKKGQLTGLQWANRLALREAMLRAGFRPLGHEWWHFDCTDGGTARKRYPVIPRCSLHRHLITYLYIRQRVDEPGSRLSRRCLCWRERAKSEGWRAHSMMR